MPRDRFNQAEALAASKARFEEAATYLRESGVIGIAEEVAASMPGVNVEVVDSFESRNAFPYVRLTGPAIISPLEDSRTARYKKMKWLKPYVSVQAYRRGNLSMYRWESRSTDNPDQHVVSISGFRTGDVPFDLKRGREMLKEGLKSGDMFPEFPW